jgi:thiamine-monophosphate kinase
MNRQEPDKSLFGSERELVDFIRSLTAAPAGNIITAAGDDAAVIRPDEGSDVVFTVDSYVCDVHFRLAWGTPRDVGYRAMAGALSDIAAMAASPVAAFVSIGIPERPRRDFIESLYRGFEDCAGPFGCRIAGGETVSTPNDLVLTISVLGSCPRGAAVGRGGASAGDLIYVTGELGRNEAAVRYLERGSETGPLRSRMEAVFFRPCPRIAEALSLRRHCELTSMIDVSDGLSTDLGRLAAESGIGALIEEASLPVSAEAVETAGELGEDPLRYVLDGGEDYELLFTVREPISGGGLEDIDRRFGIRITNIGTAGGSELMMKKSDGSRVPLAAGGYDHFERRKG